MVNHLLLNSPVLYAVKVRSRSEKTGIFHHNYYSMLQTLSQGLSCNIHIANSPLRAQPLDYP